MGLQQQNVVLTAWQADRRRYGRRAFFFERSIWAIAVLRLGQYVDTIDSGLARLAGRIAYQLLFLASEILTGISIPKSARIGPGLRIFHSGHVVIHEHAVIGANCTLRHGVTIGKRSSSSGAPVIGDNVDIGANAMILGDVTIGDSAKIGAGALVQVNMPAGSAAFAPRAIIREFSSTPSDLTPATVVTDVAAPNANAETASVWSDQVAVGD